MFDPTLVTGIGAILAVVFIIGIIGFIMFRRAYRVAAPNEALVITGRAPTRSKGGDVDLESGTRVVVGGRAIVRPLFDRAHTISLSSRQISIEIEGYSSNNIFLRLRGVAQIKVGESVADIRKAAQRFLDQQKAIDNYCQEILSGTLRAVIGTLTVEQVLRDRAEFAAQVRADAADSMNNQGLVIDTFQIISIEDDDGYLKDLGRPEAALVAERAAIAESESRRKATEASNADAQRVAESQKDLELRQAAIQRETAAEKAQAAAAEELARAEQEQRILDEKQKIADRNNELRERELIGEVQKPADAKKYAAERDADADHYRRERASAAALVEAQNDAAAAETRGRAEAAAVAARGEAEARAIEAAAEAYASYNDAARLAEILKVLPEMAGRLAEPYGSIDRLSIISSDGEGKLSENIGVNLAKVLQVVDETTGVDLRTLLHTAADSESSASQPAPGAGASQPPATTEAEETS